MTAIEEQVLALPRDSKQRLFELLRAEFDPAHQDEDDMPEWLFEELERRRLAYESGRSKSLPLAEAFASIRKELGYKQ